jgi:hypothetical protein
MPEAYVDAVNDQPFVPGQDFVPRVISELLTVEELASLKKDFDNYPLDKIRVQGHNGMGNLDIDFSNKKSIIEKVEKLVGEICGEEVEVLEANAIRYSPSFGWFVKFGPHYDARPVEMFVLDYHLQASEDWSVFVEGKKFDFHNNEALLFNGTGQVHWREQKQLADDATIDLVLFWIQHKVPRPVSKEHTDTMRTRANLVLDIIDPPATLSRDDWWRSIEISDAVLQYPDFKKISSEHKNPMSHNSVYHNNLIDSKDISKFLVSNLDGTVSVEQETIDRVSVFMKHVHAESEIEYLDSKIFKFLESNQDFGSLHETDKDVVSLAININSSKDLMLIVDGKQYTVPYLSALTLSPTTQGLAIDYDINNEDSPAEIVFFNFWLKEIY